MRINTVFFTLFAALALCSCSGGSSTQAAPVAPAPSIPTPAAPLKPLEGVTITITASGLVMDPSVPYALDSLRVYQGARLTFINHDADPHDVLSDPPHIHTDCPEINGAGFLVPGQSRATDPLNRIMSCGFHD